MSAAALTAHRVVGEDEPAPAGWELATPEAIPSHLDRAHLGAWLAERSGRLPVIPPEITGDRLAWHRAQVSALADEAWRRLWGDAGRLYWYFRPVT